MTRKLLQELALQFLAQVTGPASDFRSFEALRSCGRFGLYDDVGARAVDDCL
jgi:hypothetical protein